MTTASPPHSLYVHVPVCRHRCGYCDFYSEVVPAAVTAVLVPGLLDELQRHCFRPSCVLDTVFVGGGTPTALPLPDLDQLLEGLAKYFSRDVAAEFTVEANPATVDPDRLSVLKQAGVNRLSIGAQSFHDPELTVLERTHTVADIRATVELCRHAGFDNLSLDLIFGIPGQSAATWRASLDAAIELGIDHLSCYGLTYEPGTRLWQQRAAGTVQPMDLDLEADLYDLTIDTLEAAGLRQYELSNFARPGAECRHNLCYWHNEPYVGVGPAAAGYVDGVRYKNVSDLRQYLERLSRGESVREDEERLDEAARARETAMLALRLSAGINRTRFRERFGDDPATGFADEIAHHVTRGLLEVDDEAIRLTRTGRRLANQVMIDFV